MNNKLYKMKSTIIITLVTLGIVFNGCYIVEPDDNNMNESYIRMNYLALGDSYTIGESVDPAERWPVQLVEKLRNDGLIINDAEIIAQTGWTTDELMRGIEEARPGNNYDMVSLLIGVNNQYRGRELSNFREELARLLDMAVECAGGVKDNVFVLSIPDWGVMPFAQGRDRQQIASEIDAFNNVLKDECSGAGIKFFDITDISRQAAYDAELVAKDGLHPSGKMYGLWVDRIYSHVSGILK